jgi:hypothetical protein
MREHPILFSAPMVRAILDGRKTQTRRLAKLPHMNPLGVWEASTVGGVGSYLDKAHTIPAPEMPCIWHTRTGDCIGCKYHVGDRLYVREAFSGPHEWATIPPAGWGWDNSAVPIWYWADGNPPSGDWTKPKPGIHLPRRYSRITLEITDVRVQRLQDISEDDALAEGCRWVGTDKGRDYLLRALAESRHQGRGFQPERRAHRSSSLREPVGIDQRQARTVG